MRKNLLIATLIAVGITIWLLSGVIGGSGEDDLRPLTLSETAFERSSNRELTRVRARQIFAEQHDRKLIARGRTENKRTVAVKTEIEGRVVERPVERGQRVNTGDLLCRLSLDDREAAVAEARAELTRAEIDYQGSQRLKAQGLQSETAVAQAAAGLATARARLQRQELNLARTELRAPFDGVIEDVSLNDGDYASVGTPCVTLLDLDPMLITARVTEKDVAQLALGDSVTATTATGRKISGEITFIGNQSDQATRTYALEATVANADYSLRSGITTTLNIGLGSVLAHRVSPALFSLDDAGRIGLRIVDGDGRVEFRPVSVVDDTPLGAWVTGLPAQALLITVGHEYVAAGQRVKVEMEDLEQAAQAYQ